MPLPALSWLLSACPVLFVALASSLGAREPFRSEALHQLSDGSDGVHFLCSCLPQGSQVSLQLPHPPHDPEPVGCVIGGVDGTHCPL